MISNKDASSDGSPDFVLKHRITGAAFLIMFGVIFLPWLLGAPSEARKAEDKSAVKTVDEVTQDEIEQELLADTEIDYTDEKIEIYVSKITPLDASGNKARNEVNTIAKTEPVATEEPKAEVVKPVEKPAEPSTKQAVVKVVENKPAPVVEQVKNTVEVGWVVQVGVFTDSKGAAKVVADLKTKGFEPSTTIVDTNLGKATGTRVWLGPYAQRVEAAKSKTSLKEKTGGDGFIRAYP